MLCISRRDNYCADRRSLQVPTLYYYHQLYRRTRSKKINRESTSILQLEYVLNTDRIYRAPCAHIVKDLSERL